MSGKQAKIISSRMLQRMLNHVSGSNTPERDRVIILLSAKAGLRACEIAGLEWSMVLDARGQVDTQINVSDKIAKKQSGRRIPLHRDLAEALRQLRRRSGSDTVVVASARGGAMRPNSIVNWFVALFAELEFDGCSSHSGRRTFITSAARTLPKCGGSLRDVQLLAGHSSIETTQLYIDGDSDAQRKLVALI